MITRNQVEALWYTRMTNAELQEALGVSVYKLWMLKKRLGLPHRPQGPQPDDPDETTIAAKCLEIQAEWSPEERDRRRVGAGTSVRLRTYRLAGH